MPATLTKSESRQLAHRGSPAAAERRVGTRRGSACLIAVVGLDGQFLGYARPPSVFDPMTRQVVLTMRADQLRGTLFLPVVWRPAYLRNFDPSAHIWSGPLADAVDFGEAAPQWTRMQVLAPIFNGRLLVLNEFTGQPGWIALSGVGPVGANDAPPLAPVAPAESDLVNAEAEAVDGPLDEQVAPNPDMAADSLTMGDESVLP